MTEPKTLAVDFDPFAHGEIARTAPLSAPQREIWSAVALGGRDANCAYNEGTTLRLYGELDERALVRAIGELVARHEALRTTFAADGSMALISATSSVEPKRIDLRREPDREAAYAKLARLEVSTAFDLVRGPLFRATLVELDEREHRLLLVAHHLVCDGWSCGVILSELGALYSAYARGQKPALEAPESYAEYAHESARTERDAEGKASLTYWLAQYGEDVPVLDLPLDRPRPLLRTYAAERLDRVLDERLVEQLRVFARQHNATLLQVLLTGFQSLLARLSNQWDLVVGLSAAGQASSGRLGLVGHAVSYLPIRARLDARGSFLAALARTKSGLSDALEHQDVSFGRLLENLPIARDPSRVPLAPVSFNVEQGFQGAGFEGLEANAASIPRTHEAFEIFANLVDHKRTIVIETQYNAALFDAATIDAWLEGYEALLHDVVERPHVALAELRVLSAAQRERVLEHWNATATPYDRTATLHGLFEQQVDRTPERVALAFEDQRLSYRELDARANRIAHRLRALGVGPEQIVGVCVRRSLDMVCAQLGVLKAGAAYLPLDPRYPAERLRYMLADASAQVVITRGDSLEALGRPDQLTQQLVLLDAHSTELAALPPTRPSVPVAPDNVAYVIYTSGSTGKPKGVLVEQQNFANFLAGMEQRLTLSSAGVWLFATSIGFDISLLELFGALARGFTVVVHSDESAPEYGLARLFERHQVTHFQCTPSQATILLADPEGRRGLARLSELVLGGEALPLDLARTLRALIARGRVFNMYGPTETTIYSTAHQVREPEGNVPIGRPLANTRVYVLDELGAPVARGAIGELYIGGDGVTRGYHARPELTSERFLLDPFASALPDGTAPRMYRTGDLARQRSDGEIEFLGRNDHQVKLRGYRIELGEIELALRAHPALRDAAVIAREDAPGDKRLVAYLVCAKTPSVQELKTFLTQAGLPEYMLPQAFVALPTLPTTPSGKLDRRALPAPGTETLAVGAYVAPRTQTEHQVAALFRDVLGLGRVSVRDGFFDLGGHSLSAVRLAKRVAEAFAIELPASRVLQALTVEQLAAFVDASLLTRATRSEETRVELEL